MSDERVFLWFDAEFNTLELDDAVFLQVACMATNEALERLAPPETDVNLYVRIPEGTTLSPWVEEHLQPVLTRCRSAEAVSLEGVASAMDSYLDLVVGEKELPVMRRPVIAGNSVHNDWCLARRLLPSFVARCHYRLMDCSVMKQEWLGHFGGIAFDKDDVAAVRKNFPGLVHAEGAMQQHDAYYDVQASAAELAYYRSCLRRA